MTDLDNHHTDSHTIVLHHPVHTTFHDQDTVTLTIDPEDWKELFKSSNMAGADSWKSLPSTCTNCNPNKLQSRYASLQITERNPACHRERTARSTSYAKLNLSLAEQNLNCSVNSNLSFPRKHFVSFNSRFEIKFDSFLCISHWKKMLCRSILQTRVLVCCALFTQNIHNKCFRCSK